MRNQARASRKQGNDECERGTRMSQTLNGKQCAANRADHGVDGVPGGVNPGNFVGEEFQKIKNARDGDDHGIAQRFERLISRREGDPVEMDGEAGNKDGEVKIKAGQGGKSEGDTEEVKFFHAGSMGVRKRLSRASWVGSNDQARITNDEIMTNDEARMSSRDSVSVIPWSLDHSPFVIHTAPCSIFA